MQAGGVLYGLMHTWVQAGRGPAAAYRTLLGIVSSGPNQVDLGVNSRFTVTQMEEYRYLAGIPELEGR